jgi:hypothetical protein
VEKGGRERPHFSRRTREKWGTPAEGKNSLRSGPVDREIPRAAGENADLRDDLRRVTGALEVMP